MTRSPSSPSDKNGPPPLFGALGIPDTDESAAELGYCRTLIQAHLRKGKTNKLDYKAEETLYDIEKSIAKYFGR